MKTSNTRYRQWVRYLRQWHDLPTQKSGGKLAVPRAWLRYGGKGYIGRNRVRDREYLMRRGL